MAGPRAMMASATAPAVGLLLVLQLILLSLPAALLAADSPAAAGTTHLNFFMHDVVSGSSPTAVQVIKGPGSTAAASLGMAFGDTSVIDDPLTATSSAASAAVGRMQGMYMLSSQSGAVLMVCANILLTSGDYNGSTLAVMGRDDTTANVRELSVVGGTGRLRMANGYVLWKTTAMSGPDATVELDVYVTTGNNGSTIDASAPVSPVGGGGASDGGSGSKASSAAAYHGAGGWAVNAFAFACVVVAVVGSGVW